MPIRLRNIILPLLLGTPMVLATPAPGFEKAAAARVQAMAKAAGLPFPLKSPELRVFKSRHELELLSKGRLVKRYRVGLGEKGLADKRREGDHLTPEGRFYVCNRNERSAYHLFLGLSYPGEAAAERGLKEGIITKRQRDAIRSALRRRACPPWNTKLGGTVGIHGSGSSTDWTWGCIALEDEGIEELWVACPLGTPVIVEP